MATQQQVTFSTEVELPEGMSIPSVNKHKDIGRGGKHMFKNPRVRAYQKEMVERVKESELMEMQGLEKPIIRAHFKFRFRRRFWVRDVTNMFKATEDAVRDAISVDDSRTVHITGEKIQIEGDREYVSITLEVVDENNP